MFDSFINRLFKLSEDRRVLVLLVVGFLLIVAGGVFLTDNTSPKKPEISKDTENKYNSVKDSFNKRSPYGLYNDGVTLKYNFTPSEITQANNGAYIMSVKSLKLSDLSSRFLITTITDSSESGPKFRTSLNASGFLSAYGNLLNAALPPELAPSFTFSFKLMRTGYYSIVPNSVDPVVTTKEAATHVLREYAIYLNNSEITQKNGNNLVAIYEPVKSGSASIVSVPSFFPSQMAVEAKQTFTDGAKSLVPSISPDPGFSNYLLNEGGTFQASSFSLTAGGSVLVFIFDPSTDTLAPLLCKEAAFIDPNTADKYIIYLTAK